MKNLNARLLREFLKQAGNSLTGNWLLVGGTLLPAVGLDVRSTVDIDLVGLGEKERGQGLELMRLCDALGFPVETINSAATFFVNEVGFDKSDILPLYRGSSATIHRPTVEFYWKLKLKRLTEGDQLDCQHYLQYCKGRNDPIPSEKLKAMVQAHMRREPDPEKRSRLKILAEIVG